MRKATGNDKYDGFFDIFKWSAPVYETPEEIIQAIKNSGCIGKEIKSVRTIGNVIDIAKLDRRSLLSAADATGLRKDDDTEWWKDEKVPYLPVPFQIELSEPFQFIFTDNTTLELLPDIEHGIRIGVNTIPLSIKDSLNYSNFKADTFFDNILGQTICEFDILFEDDSSSNDATACVYVRKKYRYDFAIGDIGYLSIFKEYGGFYEIMMLSPDDKSVQTIPYYKTNNLTIEHKKQIRITSGWGDGGDVKIFPIEDTKSSRDKSLEEYGISIDTEDLWPYLGYFLDKYFDKAIQARDFGYLQGRRFDCYDENYYTYASIRLMLEHIRWSIQSLIRNPNDSILDELKANFSTNRTEKHHSGKLSKEELSAMWAEEIDMVVDFYKRFIYKMEVMMKHCDNTNLILFLGP